MKMSATILAVVVCGLASVQGNAIRNKAMTFFKDLDKNENNKLSRKEFMNDPRVPYVFNLPESVFALVELWTAINRDGDQRIDKQGM